MKKENAITLVALVMSMVILIILAGVAINITLGNNGIFNRAKTAKEQYQNAQNEEEIQLAKYSNEIDGYSFFSSHRNDIEETILWEGVLDTTNGSHETLSDSIENYKYVLIGVGYYSNKGINEYLIRVSDIKDLGYSTTDEQYLFTTYSNNHIWCAFGSNNTIYITGGCGYAYIRNVIGIK